MNCDSRETAWSCWDEWKYVGDLLYNFENFKLQVKGIDMVNMWKCRLRKGALPISVELTAALVASYHGEIFPMQNEEQWRLSMAMSIVRFVNGITDQLQTGLYAQSVQLIADQIQIPDWMVDLRHEATHSQLPGTEILKSGVMIALLWLSKNYWEETKVKIAENRSFDCLGDHLNEIIKIIASALSDHDETKTKKQKKKNIEKCISIAQTFVKSVHYGNLNDVVQTLSKKFIINSYTLNLLKLPIKSVNQVWVEDDRILPLVEYWSPILATLSNSFAAFQEMFILELISSSKRNARTDEYFGHLLTFFVVYKCGYFSTRLVDFLLEFPSKMSFQLINSIAEDFTCKKQVLSIIELFGEITDSLSKQHTVDIIPLLSKEQKEMVSKLTSSISEVDVDCFEKWQFVTSNELAKLTQIGNFKHQNDITFLDIENKYLDQKSTELIIYGKNDETKIEAENNFTEKDLTGIIEDIFKDNAINVPDVDFEFSSENKNQSQLTAQVSWDIEFDINNESVKQEILLNDKLLASKRSLIDLNQSEIVFF